MTSNFYQMKQTVEKRETEEQAAIDRIGSLEENWRKNNIVISRLQEKWKETD